ncbi:precorrin-2 dehydrogenase/sirohydrochlorin ferrochelatase family protein [Oceanobacillus neutriphilus]|uniref:precorrin-2 dehydrogenase n=1 Tax=Oceanobacillus neutriphilus TaxID=531815 RepID=A0ABQ2NZ63_9BACI|nr:NAD(P)-dependent oxidoreductase [Oceanobacillus neutriphilus]GGP14195.1 precorrin-2 dehydrogenase [Oceanobacillus neutriphilus]
MEKLYPVMMNLNGKKAVIIGGGKIALRKAKGLAGTGVKIVVVSPGIREELFKLHDVVWKQKEFEAKDIKGAHLIFAATDNKAVNEYVCQCAEANQWVNDTSKSERSDFITPAVIRRDKFILAISTSGASPELAKELKIELENRYDNKLEYTVDMYAKRRNKK